MTVHSMAFVARGEKAEPVRLAGGSVPTMYQAVQQLRTIVLEGGMTSGDATVGFQLLLLDDDHAGSTGNPIAEVIFDVPLKVLCDVVLLARAKMPYLFQSHPLGAAGTQGVLEELARAIDGAMAAVLGQFELPSVVEQDTAAGALLMRADVTEHVSEATPMRLVLHDPQVGPSTGVAIEDLPAGTRCALNMQNGHVRKVQ